MVQGHFGYIGLMGSSRLSARTLLGLIGELDPDRPVYRVIAERIRLLILDGRIPVGTRLPSERELAAQSARSRTTVVAAYQSLREAGFLVSRQGSGSIASLPEATGSGRAGRMIDFARAVPPPVEGLKDLFASVPFAAALDGPGFDLQGRLALRSALAARYSARGLPTTPEQIMVTMGGQHAIALLAHTLISRGDLALIEAPTYPHACDALRRAGARLVTTPVTSAGWDVDHLLDLLKTTRPAVAYLAPDFHNPTGSSMPAEERRAIAEAAHGVGTTLIIDETTADLDIDRGWDDGPFARHALRRSPTSGAGVVTLGSLSKSIWGGLRLGWIRASTSVIRQLIQARPAGDLGTPQMEQLLAEQILAVLPRLLDQRRELLLAHRTALSRLLAENLSQWTVPLPTGGLSLWAQLDRPLSSALTSLCEAHGLSLVAGPKFSIDGAFERFIRLPFTSPIADLDEGVRTLAATWAQLTGSGAVGHTEPRGLEVV
ncbi:GntR family transcriptional regulator [Brevibacterium sanguinis]|nr:GntR family transcriptional regulator [Brevibacterium sanguinis]